MVRAVGKEKDGKVCCLNTRNRHSQLSQHIGLRKTDLLSSVKLQDVYAVSEELLRPEDVSADGVPFSHW